MLLVVNKPAGLLAVPLGRRKESASAYSLMADHLGPRGRRKPFVVHRIDRDTSGIVVFAKSAQAQQALKDQFAAREPDRVVLGPRLWTSTAAARPMARSPGLG